MSILVILFGPHPLSGEVVILLQVHVTHLQCCAILVLLPITPPGLHVVIEDWE